MHLFSFFLTPSFSPCFLAQAVGWQSGVVLGEGTTLGGGLHGRIPTNVGGG